MTDHEHGLTQTQIDYLLSGIHKGRIRRHRNNSHVEAWDDRRTLIRAFGFTGFDIDRIACELVDVDAHPQKYKQGPNEGQPIPDSVCYTVIYRYEVRLTIKCVCGVPLGHWDEVATGDAQNQPSLGDAHDQAVKTAASQALKRACVNCGDQFGLSLYNDGGPNPVVIRSAAYVKAGESEQVQQAASDVQGGELDEQTTAAEQPDPPSPEPENQDVGVNLDAARKWIAGFKDEVKTAGSVKVLNEDLWPQLKAAQDTGFLNSRQVKELIADMSRRKTALEVPQKQEASA